MPAGETFSQVSEVYESVFVFARIKGRHFRTCKSIIAFGASFVKFKPYDIQDLCKILPRFFIKTA